MSDWKKVHPQAHYNARKRVYVHQTTRRGERVWCAVQSPSRREKCRTELEQAKRAFR